MAEVPRSRLGLAAAATAASLALHAAVLSIAVRGTGSPPEPPAVSRVVLSLAGAAMPRLAAVEPPKASVPADEAVAVPTPPAPAPTESPPVAADALAAVLPSPPAPAVAAEASPATDPEIPVSPPPVGDIPDAAVPREVPPAPDPAAPQSLAEAAPPLPRPFPLDLPAVAEAPAAGGAPLARPARAPAEVQPVIVAGTPAPAIAAPDEPPLAPVAVSSRQLAEATPPSILSPLPDAAVSAVPPPTSGAGAAPIESPPTPTPPRAAESVPAPDIAVAALEPPPVSTERVHAFVDGYDGGPCFFAAVSGTSPTGADIETFSATVDQVMAFHAAFTSQVGVEPQVVGQRVWKAQCPIVDFLRKTRPSGPNALTLQIDRRIIHTGDVVTGAISGVDGLQVALYRVSEAGTLQNLSGQLHGHGTTVSFEVKIKHEGQAGPAPQVLLAIGAPRAPSTPLGKIIEPSPENFTVLLDTFGRKGVLPYSVAKLVILTDNP